jgi:hypothetical protein
MIKAASRGGFFHCHAGISRRDLAAGALRRWLSGVAMALTWRRHAAVAAIVAASQLCSAALAADIGRWKLSLGSGRASATLPSMNTLTTGTRTIDYHLTLTVSCDAGRYPVWRQTIAVRKAISGEDRTSVTVRYDNAGTSRDEWTLADMNRTLQWDGGEGVARLSRARRFSVAWRFGVFSGSGEAIFDVAGITGALAALSEACGVRLP